MYKYIKGMMELFNTILLGKKIRHFRQNKNLSQSDLANLCNMSQPTISSLETGNISTFNILKLSIVSDALNVSLDDLLCDSIDVLKNNTHYKESFYQLKFHQLLLNLDQKQLNFSQCLVENYLSLKNFYYKNHNI